MKRGQSVRDSLANSHLNSILFLLDSSKVIHSIAADAFLVLAKNLTQLNNLPPWIFANTRLLLWEGNAEQIQNPRINFDKVFIAPFNFNEISLLTRNMIFMRQDLSDSKLIVSDLVLDLHARNVEFEGQYLQLSHKEFCLLEFFMRNRGVALTRNHILDYVWDHNQNIFTNTIDVHVAKLRRKLDPNQPERFIKTVHGFGYIFDL